MTELADSQRVVITGLGAITPLGLGVDSFFQGLLEGEVWVQRLLHGARLGFRNFSIRQIRLEIS